MTLRYVLIHKFCEESGYSEKAVRRKIEDGVWLENAQFRKAPDGRIMIDVQGVSAVEAAESLSDPAPPIPPATSGVYLLSKDGAVVYVGRATSLSTRIARHRAAGRDFSDVEVIPCDRATSIWLEKELIRTLRPIQNLVRFARHSRGADRIIKAGVAP